MGFLFKVLVFLKYTFQSTCSFEFYSLHLRTCFINTVLYIGCDKLLHVLFIFLCDGFTIIIIGAAIKRNLIVSYN